ncbi:MAG: hypothetical protein ABJA67_01835, partial [Chthonomonadales bacterium]
LSRSRSNSPIDIQIRDRAIVAAEAIKKRLNVQNAPISLLRPAAADDNLLRPASTIHNDEAELLRPSRAEYEEQPLNSNT